MYLSGDKVEEYFFTLFWFHNLTFTTSSNRIIMSRLVFFFSFIQTKIIWEEVISIEKMLPSYWFIGKYVGHVLDDYWYGRTQSTLLYINLDGQTWVI